MRSKRLCCQFELFGLRSLSYFLYCGRIPSFIRDILLNQRDKLKERKLIDFASLTHNDEVEWEM